MSLSIEHGGNLRRDEPVLLRSAEESVVVDQIREKNSGVRSSFEAAQAAAQKHHPPFHGGPRARGVTRFELDVVQGEKNRAFVQEARRPLLEEHGGLARERARPREV